MKAPLQVTFRNVEPSPMVKEWVRTELEKLESFYSSIMDCRVAIELPHRHRIKGSLYHVRIDLRLPGGELVVDRQPSPKKLAHQAGKIEITKKSETGTPHKDLRLAIDDAFRLAGRRLHDYARRQSGYIKTHEPPAKARVSALIPDEGYGFLLAEDGREIYFHKRSVLNGGFARLRIGTVVTFVEEQGEKGPQASTVRIAGKAGFHHTLRPAELAALP